MFNHSLASVNMEINDDLIRDDLSDYPEEAFEPHTNIDESDQFPEDFWFV